MKIEDFKAKLAELAANGKIVSSAYNVAEEVTVDASDVEISESDYGKAVIFDKAWFSLRGKEGEKYKLRIEEAFRDSKGTIRSTGQAYEIKKGNMRLTAVAA